MESPYDPNTPMETIIEHICKCNEYADTAQQGYSDHQVMECFLDKIKETGAYPLDVRDWNAKPENEKSIQT